MFLFIISLVTNLSHYELAMFLASFLFGNEPSHASETVDLVGLNRVKIPITTHPPLLFFLSINMIGIFLLSFI